MRLSFHPSQYVLLNSPDKVIVKQSVADLVARAEILDVMGLGPEAVLVTRVGGTYGDPAAPGWCWRTTTRGTRPPTRSRSTR